MDTYKKNKGNAGLPGVQFQINLLVVTLLNSLRSFSKFKISTENEDGAKFDDIVLELNDGSAVFLQAKHKENKKINMEQLLSINSKQSDFSLLKYFFSYYEIKLKFKARSIVLCTNTQVDVKGLQDIVTRQNIDSDSMLYSDDSTISYLTFNENIVPVLMEKAEEYYEKNLKTKNIDKSVISQENMKDFLNKLQLIFNYPSGEDLCRVIEQMLCSLNTAELFSTLSHHNVYKKVEDWFQQRRGEYLTESRAKAMFSEIRSDRYCETLKNYNVWFAHNNFNFKNFERLFHIKTELGHLLQVLKVYGALQNDEGKKLFVNPDDDIETLKQIVEAFGLPRYSFLIITWPKSISEPALKEIGNKLNDVLGKYKYKKVILIAGCENTLLPYIGLSDSDCKVMREVVTLLDLSNNSRKRLMSMKSILFQGNCITLEELLTGQTAEDYASVVHSEILERLVRGEKIKVGERLSHLDADISRYYIHRTFKREYTKLEEDGPEKSLSNIGKVFGGKELTGDRKEQERFTEQSIYDVKEKVILIADGAGTGKSTVLTKLAVVIKRKEPHLWVIRLELNDYTRILRDFLKNEEKEIDIIQMLNSKASSSFSNHLEEHVFGTTNKVVLLLDAFDEICPDYTELILQLIGHCARASNFQKIFVTTRSYISKELVLLLGLKPFILEPFTEQNQVDFLSNYWVHNLKLDDTKQEKCEKYARALISHMSSWVSKADFAEIPLQVRMLAEIFQENTGWCSSNDWIGCMEYLNEDEELPKMASNIDITKLYDMLIRKKLEIFIAKGNPNGGTAANQSFLSQYDEYFTQHQSFALDLILQKTVMLNKTKCSIFSCYRADKTIETTILKIGIVQKLDDKIEFIHRTFAEYFVAKSIVRELELQNQDSFFQLFFMEELLLYPQHEVIRVFVDKFLGEVVDVLPCNVFRAYQDIQYLDMAAINDRSRILHVVAEKGYVAIFKFILKCLDFKIITDKEIPISDLNENNVETSNQNYSFRKMLSFIQYLKPKFIGKPKKDCINTLTILRRLVQKGGVNIRDNDGQTPLYYATYRGHLEMVKVLVEQGAKIDTKSKKGRMPIHSAALWGYLDILKFFVNVGVDVTTVDNTNTTTLHYASFMGNLKVARFLVQCGVDMNAANNEGEMPIHMAAARGHLDVVKLLIDSGVDYNVTTFDSTSALHCAAMFGHLDVIKFLLKSGVDINAGGFKGNNLIHNAAGGKREYLEIIKFAVANGVDVNVTNDDNITALHVAAETGHVNIVKFLIDKGADCGRNNNPQGVTALHIASWRGHLDVVKVLVERGANFNIGNYGGEKVLHIAGSHLDIIRYFVAIGVDVNVTNNRGNTALHVAAYGGHLEIVKFLVDSGADPCIANNEGITALHLATKGNHLDVVKLLTQLDSRHVNEVEMA